MKVLSVDISSKLVTSSKDSWTPPNRSGHDYFGCHYARKGTKVTVSQVTNYPSSGTLHLLSVHLSNSMARAGNKGSATDRKQKQD